jgi:hypothetical protein
MVGIECDSIPHPTYMEAEWSNGMRDVIYVVKEKRKDAVLRGVVSHKIVAQFQYRRNAESFVRDSNGYWSDRLVEELCCLTGTMRGKGKWRKQEIKEELRSKKFVISEVSLDD